MATKWNCHLLLALTFVLCLFLPGWLLAQSSNTNNSNTASTNTGTTSESNTVGQIQGSERFLRENRDAGQMVGGDVQGIGNLRGQTDGGSQNTSGMFGGQNSYGSRSMLSNMMNSGMFGSSRQQRQQLRVPLRIGPNSFPFASTTPPVTTGPNLRVQNRLARLPQLKDRGSVEVEMEGQVAVLRGAVTSQHERDLVARLVLLEPGIEDVRNELQVGAAPVPQPSPKP